MPGTEAFRELPQHWVLYLHVLNLKLGAESRSITCPPPRCDCVAIGKPPKVTLGAEKVSQQTDGWGATSYDLSGPCAEPGSRTRKEKIRGLMSKRALSSLKSLY